MRTVLYGGIRVVDSPDPANIYKLDLMCLPMIDEFHVNGILADLERFRWLASKLDSELSELSTDLEITAGRAVNVNSPVDLRDLIFHDLKLVSPIGEKRTSTGAVSVDSDTMRSLIGQHPAVDLILKIRELLKIKSTYVDKLPQMVESDGRIRTTFRHTNTETGRLSSENPNLQNIPTRTKTGMEVRNCFIAAPGRVLVSCDLSQIEMVVSGHLSGDENILTAFREGYDIHTLTALTAFGYQGHDREYFTRLSRMAKREEEGVKVEWTEKERKDWKEFKQTKRLPAKTIGFGVLYGQTAEGAQWNVVSQGGPVLPLQRCEDIINGFFTTYPGIKRWMQEQEIRARTRGMVWDMFGRVRMLPAAMSSIPRVASKAVREAGNMPVQSSAQGIIKLCMAEGMMLVERWREKGVCVLPLLQIHDELVFEVSEDHAEEFAKSLREIMVNCVDLRVKHSASYSISKRWGELK